MQKHEKLCISSFLSCEFLLVFLILSDSKPAFTVRFIWLSTDDSLTQILTWTSEMRFCLIRTGPWSTGWCSYRKRFQGGYKNVNAHACAPHFYAILYKIYYQCRKKIFRNLTKKSINCMYKYKLFHILVLILPYS